MGLGNPMPAKYPRKRYISVISQEDTQICLALDGAAIFLDYYIKILKRSVQMSETHRELSPNN